MKEAKLRPCPFCGGEAALKKSNECVGHGDYICLYYVACEKCRAEGGNANCRGDQGDLESLAVERWNRRAYERKAD